ncbi:MAG: biliverdin-producing heme oxygenase [Methylococcaceae bacterium]|nr:biliverdin-producing heme oxygenase [Methylococcaceae bacterium]
MKPNQDMLIPLAENKSSVMVLLKSETSTAHRQLERNRSLSRLFQSDYSILEYQELIGKFYGFFSAIEPLIFNDVKIGNSQVLRHRSKTASLASDLALLGVNGSMLTASPCCENLPLLDSFARRMGAFYVLEGSTLGGRIISKRLKEHFGESILDKLNYYQSYGDDLMTEWAAFQHFMANHFDGKTSEITEVVSAATETFSCLDSWLQKA